MKSLKSQSVCALLKGWVVQSATTPAFSESIFNDGTTHNGTRPPYRATGSHHLKRLVYGGLGLGLILSEMSEGLVGSEWLLVGIGAIKELISV